MVKRPRASTDGRRGRKLRLVLLSGICLSAVAAHAQDATWVGNNAGDPNEWVENNNWNPATIPTGTATFDATALTTAVANDAGVVFIGGLNFTGTAPAFTFGINNAFIITGAGVVNNSTNAQTFNVADSLIFQNNSTANSGTGAVTYNNSGFIYFQNSSNAGNGATTIINNSIVQFFDMSSAASAAITNNAVMDFFDSTTAGNSTITNAATGTLTFYNNSTAASSVIQNSGTVNFNGNSTADAAMLNNANGSVVTFNDSSNAGTSVIDSTSGGTVTFNNNSSAANSTINISSTATLTFNDASDAGSAILNAFNTGAIYFFGTSSGGLATFAIGTGGVLDISGLTSAGTTAGSIAGLGNFFLGAKTLTVGGNDQSTTVGGVIADGGLGGGIGGGLTKVGAGILTLSGLNTYTGATEVAAGALVVNGSIAASALTTVDNGALLAGTGTVGNTSVLAGGIFMPGSGVPGSSMMVAGNLTFASGAFYQVALDPTTSSFATVSGTATLGGATVNAIWAAGSYIQRQYTILDAGAVNGTFASIVNTNLPTGFFPTLSYDATHVYLNLTMGFPTPGGPLNTNQQNVANALINSFNVNGGIPMVFGMLTAQGLTEISGELGASFPQIAFQAGNSFLALMLNPFVDGRSNSNNSSAMAFADDAKPVRTAAALAFAAVDRKSATFDDRYSIWGAALVGASGSIDGDATTGSHDTSARFYGFAAGLDYRVTPDTVLGFALAGGGTSWSLAQGLGSGRSDMFQAGLYGMTHWGPAYFSAALAYSFHDVSTTRTVTIAGNDVLEAGFHANVFSGRVEGGYRYAISGIGLTPYGAVQVQSIALPGYGETATSGSPLFALNYASQDVTTTRTELGARLDKSFLLGSDAILTVYSRAAWAHDFNTTRSANAIFQALPASNFTVYAAEPSANGALVSAGAEYKLASGWSVMAKFDGEFSKTTSLYSGTAVIRKVW